MTRQVFLLVLAGVLLNAMAQLLLKAGVRPLGAISISASNGMQTLLTVATQPFIIAGLLSYVLSVAIWIGALSRVDVSIAYPMLSLGYVVNALLAWRLFDEQLSVQRIAGIGVILVGVFVLARS